MKSKKQVILSILLILGCLWFAVSLTLNARSKTKDIQTIHGGWQIAISEGEYVLQPTKDLSDYSFHNLKEGDVIHLQRRLSEFDFTEARLILDTWHVAVRVSLDGKEIYSSGEEYIGSRRMLGNIRHYVELPAEYQGKILHIDMICTEDDAMSGLLPIGIADIDDMSVEYFNRLYPLLLPAAVMVGVGLITMLLGAVFYSKENNLYKIFYLGMLLLFVGVYSLCRAQFVRMILPQPEVYNAVEFLSLYILPISLVYLFLEDRHRLTKPYLRVLYAISRVSSVAFAVITTVLHFLNLVSYVKFLNVFYVLIVIEVLIQIMVSRNLVSKDDKAGYLYFWSVIMVLIGAVLAIFAFQLRYTKLNERLHIWRWQEYLFVVFFFAAGIFAAIALAMEISRVMYDSLYAAMYKKIAYTDVLTGLKNRRSFEEELQWLEGNQESTSYGIVCFDLNDLKKFNDTMGHDAGDTLLKKFANILQSVCGTEVSAYRVGGDEFVAIIRNTKLIDTETFTRRISEAIREANTEGEVITVSSSYGAASQGEKESVHKVYLLADERMYEHKAKVKGN